MTYYEMDKELLYLNFGKYTYTWKKLSWWQKLKCLITNKIKLDKNYTEI